MLESYTVNMATMLRSLVRQGRSLQVISQRQPLRPLVVPFLNHLKLISTSKKNKDVGITVQPMEKSAELKKLTEHFADTDENKEENWTSYGFDDQDRDLDWFYHHLIMFMTVSFALCGSIFIVAYMPDNKFMDWGKREAFLELERRERLGLPLVDPEYVKLEDIELPSDEEIGDKEIII